MASSHHFPQSCFEKQQQQPNISPSSTTSSSKQESHSPPTLYTISQITNQFNLPPTRKPSTLNPDPSGQTLAFVLVFKDQHPSWPPWVSCKTNLDLLSPSSAPQAYGQGYRFTYETNLLDHAIPVFAQDDLCALDASRKMFALKGWFRIEGVLYLEPRSEDVIKLLDRKFTFRGVRRRAEQWEAALAARWAVVDFQA
ncbi:MAG: hypothetical protein Q9201_006760, partial [Fulgogasparrea decipioides]